MVSTVTSCRHSARDVSRQHSSETYPKCYRAQAHASAFADAKLAWERSSKRPFPGYRLDGVMVRSMEKQLPWWSATISGAYDPLSGRYAEVTFEDGDDDGRHKILARFVRAR